MRNKRLYSAVVCACIGIAGLILIGCDAPSGASGTPGQTPGPRPSPGASPTPTPSPSADPSPTPSPTATPTPGPTLPPDLSCGSNNDCDDEQFCNGQERCVLTKCQPGDDPCPSMFELCDEALDECVLDNDPRCMSNLDCLVVGQVCDTETGECVAEGSTCGPGSGNCFAANFTAGCEMQSCCDVICLFEQQCCSLAWDESCAEMAFQFCPLEP